MTYLLYRADGPDATEREGQLLGCHATFVDAFDARDRDVLEQLEQSGGRRREMTHLILGPGLRGPATRHPVVCCVGRPGGGPVPLAQVLADTASWLARVRSASAAGSSTG